MLETVTSALLKLATTVIEYAKSLHKMAVSSFETQIDSSASQSSTVTDESHHEIGDQTCEQNHTENNSTFDLWVIVLTLSQIGSSASQLTITIPGMIPSAIAVMIWITVQVYYRTTVPRPARGSSQVSVTQPSHRPVHQPVYSPVEQLAQDLAGSLSRSAIA